VFKKLINLFFQSLEGRMRKLVIHLKNVAKLINYKNLLVLLKGVEKAMVKFGFIIVKLYFYLFYITLNIFVNTSGLHEYIRI